LRERNKSTERAFGRNFLDGDHRRSFRASIL
jgi:hypothetical protein